MHKFIFIICTYNIILSNWDIRSLLANARGGSAKTLAIYSPTLVGKLKLNNCLSVHTCDKGITFKKLSKIHCWTPKDELCSFKISI